MTIRDLPSSTADNFIRSSGSTYAAARGGTDTVVDEGAGDTIQSCGQTRVFSTLFLVDQWFAAHDNSSVTASGAGVPVSAQFVFFNAFGLSNWLLVAREKNWGTAVDSADFVAGAAASGLPFLAQAQISPGMSSTIAAGSTELLERVSTAGPIRVMWGSDRTRLGLAPTGDENVQFDTGDSDSPPLLRVLTVPESLLLYVGGAAVQLSDGSHMTLQVSGVDTASPIVSLIWTSRTGDSTATIDAVPTGDGAAQFALQPAFQSLALARDAADNVYVIGPRGSSPTTAILAKAWKKGTGVGWSPQTAIAASVPAYPKGTINNVAAAWHPTSGAGHLMVVLSHTAGAGKTGQVAYATLSCAALLAGTGTALVETAADPAWLGISSDAGPAPYTNETGTNLDIATPTGSTVGAVYTCDAPTRGINGRYTLTAAGGVDAALSAAMPGDGVVTHDADAKVRAVPIGPDRVAFVAAGHVAVRSYAGTLLGFADLPDVGMDTFPTADALRGSAAWDVVYDPASNKIWHYYFDTGDNRRLMRTGVDLSTYQATGEETLVNGTVGATGAVNVALRAPRGTVDERVVVLDVANRTTGGDLSSETVVDSFNAAPSPPTLTPQSTFDATLSRLFAWTFADPNPADTQTAYQLVVNAASGASATYDSGKVLSAVSNHTLPGSSIPNNRAWQWKVRTWDAADVAGSFSTLAAFSTTSAGVVTITTPAADNQADINTSTVTVSWLVTGAVQAQRRIRVIETSTGTTHSDTGFTASTSTTGNITGLGSDVEYRVEVTIKDGSGIVSTTGTRLVTSSYAQPPAPVITAQPSGDDGYILVSVSNPVPEGDEPDISSNELWRRETGALTWTRIAVIARDESYRDYATASGQSYEYKVVGVV